MVTCKIYKLVTSRIADFQPFQQHIIDSAINEKTSQTQAYAAFKRFYSVGAHELLKMICDLPIRNKREYGQIIKKYCAIPSCFISFIFELYKLPPFCHHLLFCF